MSENSQNNLPTILEDFRKFSEIFGSVLEILGKLRKPSENFRMHLDVYENFITFQYLTPMD